MFLTSLYHHIINYILLYEFIVFRRVSLYWNMKIKKGIRNSLIILLKLNKNETVEKHIPHLLSSSVLHFKIIHL